MSDAIPVKIVSVSRYLGEQDGMHAFAYTIHITNRGHETIQLLDRHWFITHGNGNVEQVMGEGVVGETPELAPGQSFSYTSGALIPTRVGSMKGSYGFIAQSGDKFRAEIPEFALAVPSALN